MRVEVSLFELPTLLGIPQHVEYEPPPREWCTPDGCPHEGILTAEGCRKGVCVRYRSWVYSSDGRRWTAKGRRRGERDEEGGGCLRQQVADALWEVAERGFDVGVWYRKVTEKVGMLRYEVHVYCGPVVNGVELGQPRCRSVAECVREILREYERRFREPPKPRRSPEEEEEEYEELLQRYPPLRFWNKASVIDALRRSDARWGL